VRHVVAQLYERVSNEGGHVHRTAIAGIEEACWDILGKSLGVPVHLIQEHFNPFNEPWAHPYDADAFLDVTAASWEQRLGQRDRSQGGGP
jgi:hypothetical protein